MFLTYALRATTKFQFLALAVFMSLPLPSFAFGCVWDGHSVFFQLLTADQQQEPFVARVKIEIEDDLSRRRDKSFLNLDFPVRQADVTFGSGGAVVVVVTKAESGFSTGDRVKIWRTSRCSSFSRFKKGTEWYIAGDFKNGKFVPSGLPGLPDHAPPNIPDLMPEKDLSRFEF